jgi:hypothetical protein
MAYSVEHGVRLAQRAFVPRADGLVRQAAGRR